VIAILTLVACQPATPDDFAVRLGESGGFTGWTTGYKLSADGEVSKVTDRLDSVTQVESVGRLDASQRQQLWEMLATFEEIEDVPQGGGNLKRFVQVVANGETQRREWTVGPPQDPPHPLVDLYDRCREILSSAGAVPE